jgi:hypothetical protein
MALPFTAYGYTMVSKECRADYKKWQKRENHKAFAVSRDTRNGQACGFAYRYGTKQDAINEAIRRCRQIAATPPKISNPDCRVFKAF